MKGLGFTSFVRGVSVGLAAVGLCIPQLALAAAPSNNQASVIADVQLREGGVLFGRVVTPENVAVAGTDVSLSSDNRELAVGKTDQNGRFTFAGLHNGFYRVAAAEGRAICPKKPLQTGF